MKAYFNAAVHRQYYMLGALRARSAKNPGAVELNPCFEIFMDAAGWNFLRFQLVEIPPRPHTAGLSKVLKQ